MVNWNVVYYGQIFMSNIGVLGYAFYLAQKDMDSLSKPK
jgi:hypothetical protein